MPTAEASPRLLLVEGEDDYHVVAQLRRRHPLAQDVAIESKGGVDRLLAAVRDEVRIPGRIALGILLDADDNVAAQWQQVRERLEPLMVAGVSPPDEPVANGTIIEVQHHRLLPRVRVGVWLMPDNQAPGELEDFVRQMIPGDDPVWPRAESYIDGIPQADRRFRDGKVSRAELYAWLATRELPGRMGAAINAGDLNTDADLARRFVSWLHALFS